MVSEDEFFVTESFAASLGDKVNRLEHQCRELQNIINTYLQIMANDAENEAQARDVLRKYLTSTEVDGDSYCVPTLADAIELLAKKFGAIERSS